MQYVVNSEMHILNANANFKSRSLMSKCSDFIRGQQGHHHYNYYSFTLASPSNTLNNSELLPSVAADPPAQKHGNDIIRCTCKAWENCRAVGGFSEFETSGPNLLSCVLLISCRFCAAARSHHAHALCNGSNHNTRPPNSGV